MADFVTYNKAAGRYEPVPGQVRTRRHIKLLNVALDKCC